jgi:hypothetical protein
VIHFDFISVLFLFKDMYYTNVQMFLIRHILNVMHFEKNLCENIMKTVMHKKDNSGLRQDMEDLDI